MRGAAPGRNLRERDLITRVIAYWMPQRGCDWSGGVTAAFERLQPTLQRSRPANCRLYGLALFALIARHTVFLQHKLCWLAEFRCADRDRLLPTKDFQADGGGVSGRIWQNVSCSIVVGVS
jgi:hypothetical protein